MEDQIKDLQKRIDELKLKNEGMAMQIDKLRRQLYYAEKDRVRLEMLEGERIEQATKEQNANIYT